MANPQKSAKIVQIAIVVATLLVLALLFMFRRGAGPPAATEEEKAAAATAAAAAARPETDPTLADTAKAATKAHSGPDFSGLSLEEKAQVAAARNYAAVKQRYRERGEAKRQVKEAYYTQGGDRIAEARKAMRAGNHREAISGLLQALRESGNNGMVRMTAYRHLAESYEAIGEVPKYCINMFKYLDMLEPTLTDTESLQQVRSMKAELKKAIDKMKETGNVDEE